MRNTVCCSPRPRLCRDAQTALKRRAFFRGFAENPRPGPTGTSCNFVAIFQAGPFASHEQPRPADRSSESVELRGILHQDRLADCGVRGPQGELVKYSAVIDL